GEGEGRKQRRAGVRHRRAPGVRARRRTCRDRGARHRLSRGAAGRSFRRLSARAGHAAGVEPRDRAGRGDVVSLFRADLQRPPHPLRPALCGRGGILSRPRRPRAADGHLPDRPSGDERGCAAAPVRVPLDVADVRRRHAVGQRDGARRRGPVQPLDRHGRRPAGDGGAGMAVTARPLDGVTVVSLEQAIAAPYCTRLLADLGARVIKIERPGTGDFARAYDTRANGLASHFVWCNRSKESVALDLKKPGAVDAVKALLRTADVFVQSLAPGAAGRMGLGGEDLRVLNPQLIVCNISGYGAGGAWSQRKAYDLLIQAEAGFLSITGPRDEPAKAGISIA